MKPILLIVVLLALVLVLIFAGFNLDNSFTISFGFATIEIPVLFGLVITFVFGVVTVAFFPLFSSSRPRANPKLKPEHDQKEMVDTER